MNAEGIVIVGASAGSGKTFRLTQEVTSALSPTAPDRIDVTALVAITYTRKAQAELEARIRRDLVSAGAFEEAQRLPLAYLGTVHAAALRLLQEFAIDAGLSVNVEVVAGNETRLLRQAFERTLDEGTRARLDDLAMRLELRIDHRTRRTDWVTPVADIMDLARSNRISPDALPAMAESSIERLLAFLPPPARDGSALDAALASELDRAGVALAAADDGKKNTAEALRTIQGAKTRLADGELRWSEWAKLAAIAPSKACDRAVVALRPTAARYEEHPRLHEELRATTRAVFDAARAGLVAYQAWKTERRVVDYVDMIDGALELLEHPRVRAELAGRLRLTVIDEFQDTSPIQLALFVRLHGLSRRSVWVGDRKQCIFEYAGADPLLMDAVADWAETRGGKREQLEENHRSRPELVRACSELFAAALARHGFTREEVVVRARRPNLDALTTLPPLGLWALEVDQATDDAEAVAEGVRRTLMAPHETPVLDRARGEVRPVRAGDIAILVATNDWATRVAEALHARGVRAAIARAGLFATPEGTLADAALRWLVDASDRWAAAVIDALTGWDGRRPDEWLAERLGKLARAHAGGDDAEDVATTPSGWRAELGAVRPRLSMLAPTEALDATLAALDAVHLCARWPDPAQRIANLDALRAAGASYEARCAQEREAATVAGMLRHFDQLRSPRLQRDEMLASDDQHVPSDDGAVVVCTYHKSKGLEWPVVVLTNLDRSERRTAFDVAPESRGAGFDPERPLEGRAIRYWPWPLGATKKARLADAAERSMEGRAVALREQKERARLLYVGFTRARDHLVLAARISKGTAKTAWLDALTDADDRPILELPVAAGDGTVDATCIRVRGEQPMRVATRVLRLGNVRSRTTGATLVPVWFARPPLTAGERARPAYRIAPSSGADDWPELAVVVASSRLGAIERLGSAMALDGKAYDYDVLGNAVHAFLAGDVEGLDAEARLARARAQVNAAGLSGVVRAEALVGAGEALRRWVEGRWPRAVWHRELPIDGIVASEHGERRASGVIDLLLETPDGYVIVDHKTFPALAEAAWRAKWRAVVPQLAAYARLVDSAGPLKVLECWVHLPVGGGMVEIVFAAVEQPRVDGGVALAAR